MKPLSAMPFATRAEIRCVFTDIDDTITTEGRLPAAAYAALEVKTARFILAMIMQSAG